MALVGRRVIEPYYEAKSDPEVFFMLCDKLGLDKDRLKKDAASDKTSRIIAQDLDDAKKLKIDGTPCFLVNGLMVRGALSEPLFEAAVDIALEAAR